jgi:Rieske Fe-S protein
MKRPDALVSLSRRDFCGTIAGCLGIAAIAGCGGSSSPMGTPDAAVQTDGQVQGTCPATGANDVGAATTFMTGKPVYFRTGNFWVVRDAGGLYALTARCTHQGVTISAETSDFFCTAHGATFDFNGNVTGGPTSTNLVHYALCLLGSGNVGVIKSQTVAQSQRLVA